MKKLLIYLGFIIAIVLNTSCNKSYKKNQNGLEYIMYSTNSGTKPKEGDIIYCNIVYKKIKPDEDSTFFSSIQQDTGIMYKLSKPTCMGCIEEGLMMMSEGDTASFMVSADSFFVQTNNQELPSFFNHGDKIKLEVKMFRITTEKQIADEQKAHDDEIKGHEETALTKYLKKENITVQPSSTGLYYLERRAGDCDAMAVDGDKVEINYSTTLLDEVSNSKYTKQSWYGLEEILHFTMGQNSVIPGLEEAIKKMKPGGTATLIIPSQIAYGTTGGSANLIIPAQIGNTSSSWGNLTPPSIPPSATLLVKVELHAIVDPTTMQIKKPCY